MMMMMMNKTPKTSRRPPWSRKKRLLVRAALSGFIGLSALVLGSGLYGIGRVMGFLKPFNLVKAVTDEVMKNPTLVSQFYTSLSTTTCTNDDLHFQISYGTGVQATPTEDQYRCTELTLKRPDGGMTYLKIQGYTRSMAETVKEKVDNLQDLETDIFAHPLYEATQIRGTAGSIPVMTVVVPAGEAKSYSLTYYPREPEFEPLIAEVIRSFKINGFK